MPDALKRQIGPFPLGVWLIIIAAGVGLGVAMNRRIGSTDEEPVVLEPDTGRDPFSAGVGAAMPAVTGATMLGQAPPSTTTGSYAPTTNDEWIAAAVKLVTAGDGAPQPLAALTALQAFVDGQPLSASQTGIVNRAVGALGPPPYGAALAPTPSPPASSITPTVPTPAPPRSPYGRHETIVAEAYRDILGREPDAGGLKYYADALRHGNMTAAQIRAEMAASLEGQQLAGRR